VARSKRNLTVRIRLGNEPAWFKQFRPSGPVDRLNYALRPGKAVYAWNAAMALIESGFHAPRPLLGLRTAGRLGGGAGIVVFEDIAGHVMLRQVLGDDASSPTRDGSAIRDLGLCLRRFHDLGFRHRDLRQGNILAAPTEAGWEFYFLDLNRLRVQPPLTILQRLREVERLNLPVQSLAAFFQTYMPDRDSREMAAVYQGRLARAGRLERLPLARLVRKAWYYSEELRAYSRARRP